MNPHLLNAGLTEQPSAPSVEGAEWEVVECAVDLIAGHYHLDRDLVWAAVFELEDSWEERTGLSGFGVLLDHPCGFTTLGLRVAGLVLGETEAQALPPLLLSYH